VKLNEMTADKSDKGESTKQRLAGVAGGLIAIALYAVLSRFVDSGRAISATLVFFTFTGVIYVKGRELLNPYYISTLSALFAIEFPLAFLVNIPRIRTGYVGLFFPIVLFDFVLITAVLFWVKKLFRLPDRRG
jgi:hypothetical protein